MREAYNMFKDGGDPEKVQFDVFSIKIYNSIISVRYKIIY